VLGKTRQCPSLLSLQRLDWPCASPSKLLRRRISIIRPRDGGSSGDDLGQLRSGIYLRWGLDRLTRDLPVGLEVTKKSRNT
jgi:hypothetical protein